ncbi:MAG: hypothetical protein H7301_10245 [Cryobacterium sp.]|nr:hypothetical protein [Oligoflexia bacterium]
MSNACATAAVSEEISQAPDRLNLSDRKHPKAKSYEEIKNLRLAGFE